MKQKSYQPSAISGQPSAVGGRENLESEVKFLVADLAAMRDRLLAAGAALHMPRTYEYNVRFDNAWDGLARNGQLLRLRQDGRARLTYKGNPGNPVESEAKVREELEVEVSDFETAALLLQRLGFEARQVYEKYRETYRLGEVEVVLDEMPFGDFVELEGEEVEIRRVAADLGFDWQQRIVENYLTLMARLKEHHRLAFDDVTFANFANMVVSVKEIL